jgi:hypothetical protein
MRLDKYMQKTTFEPYIKLKTMKTLYSEESPPRSKNSGSSLLSKVLSQKSLIREKKDKYFGAPTQHKMQPIIK